MLEWQKHGLEIAINFLRFFWPSLEHLMDLSASTETDYGANERTMELDSYCCNIKQQVTLLGKF